MEAKLNLRLDGTTERELRELVEHFTQRDSLRRPVTASDIARNAIHELHQRTVSRKPGRR